MCMLDNILTVGNQVIILFVLIAVGFICAKVKLFDDKAVKGFTDFVLYVVTPCVIINSYQRQFDVSMLKGLLTTFTAAALSFAADILLAHIAIHDKDKKRERVLRFGAVFSNCGYMSLPLQNALLGSDGVFYGATYIAVFNIVLWTYGVVEMSGEKKYLSVKKMLLNPGIIGTVCGVALFLLSVRLPSVLAKPIEHLAALNTPVPMIIIGCRLAKTKIRLRGYAVYVAIAVRLVAAPLIMLFGLYALGVRGNVLASLTIAASAPCAANTTMFSEKFGTDTSLSAALVSVTTIISVITMPFIVGIAEMIK